MKSQKFFAALLAGALTLGVVPFTQFNADVDAGPSVIISPDKNEKFDMEGENLNPGKSYSTPIVQYNDKIYESSELLEKDKQEIKEGLQKGYISVPDDPNEPMKALTEDEVNEALDNQEATLAGQPQQQSGDIQTSANPDTAQQSNPDVTQQAQLDARANDNANKSHIINITYCNVKEYFGYVSFEAKSGDTAKKLHVTSYKTLKGSRDTNNIIYCLQMNKDNPPDGEEMEFMAKESSELLYLIRLGHPRGSNMGNKLIPQEIKDCFYPS